MGIVVGILASYICTPASLNWSAVLSFSNNEVAQESGSSLHKQRKEDLPNSRCRCWGR